MGQEEKDTVGSCALGVGVGGGGGQGGYRNG